MIDPPRLADRESAVVHADNSQFAATNRIVTRTDISYGVVLNMFVKFFLY